jgi:hypothetical protein
MEDKAVVPKRNCSVCATDLPLDQFSSHYKPNSWGVPIQYYRGDCKSCRTNTTYKKIARCVNKFSEEEKAKMKANKDNFGRIPHARFHAICGLKMNPASFYRYVRKGDIEKMLSNL